MCIHICKYIYIYIYIYVCGSLCFCWPIELKEILSLASLDGVGLSEVSLCVVGLGAQNWQRAISAWTHVNLCEGPRPKVGGKDQCILVSVSIQRIAVGKSQLRRKTFREGFWAVRMATLAEKTAQGQRSLEMIQDFF